VLTSKDKETFFNRGWIVKPQLFNAEEIQQMRACFEGLEAQAATMEETGLNSGSYFVLGKKTGEQIIKRVVWAGGSQPFLLSIGADPRLTEIASELLDTPIIEQLLSQAHFKRPGDGVTFGWHQDIHHRDKGQGTWRDINGRGSFVQTLIAVDDMTPNSGPLKFIPNSASWGNLMLKDSDYESANEHDSTLPFDPTTAVTIEAKAGDTLFFGPYTVHASFENTSESYRRVFINGYAYPGANNRVYPGEGACRKLTVRHV